MASVPLRFVLAGTVTVCTAAGLFAQDSSTPRLVSDGIYTADQGRRGEAAYNEHCAMCHAEDLSGQTPYNASPSLTGRGFRLRWEDKDLADLFTFIRERMPLNREGKLKGEEYANITAFILQVNGYPAGRTPLTDDVRTLKGIKLTNP